jgi:hypothetical protein
MTNAIKVLLQMQSGFLQLESTLVTLTFKVACPARTLITIFLFCCPF